MHCKKAFILSILFFLGTEWSFGQPGDPTGDPDVVPLAGLGYLLAAGAVLGVRKIYNNMKKS